MVLLLFGLFFAFFLIFLAPLQLTLHFAHLILLKRPNPHPGKVTWLPGLCAGPSSISSTCSCTSSLISTSWFLRARLLDKLIWLMCVNFTSTATIVKYPLQVSSACRASSPWHKLAYEWTQKYMFGGAYYHSGMAAWATERRSRANAVTGYKSMYAEHQVASSIICTLNKIF